MDEASYCGLVRMVLPVPVSMYRGEGEGGGVAGALITFTLHVVR